MNTEWKLVNALRDSLLWTASSLAAIGKEQDVITLEGRKRTVGEILDEANEALNVPDDAAPTSHHIPTGETGEDGQSAFERWLERTCPSGDVESVQRQWEASSDYADFHAPAAGDARTLPDAVLAALVNKHGLHDLPIMQVYEFAKDLGAAIAQQSQRKEA